MKTQPHLTAIVHKQYHPRKEPKYWTANFMNAVLDQNNSIKLLRHKFKDVPGIIFKSVR